MKRVLFALCVLAAPAFASVGPDYCFQNPASPANCSNQNWIDICDTPTPDPDPCTVPQADGKSYVEQAQEAWQLSHDAPRWGP